MSVVRGIVRESGGGNGTSTSTYVPPQPQPQPQPQVIVQREIIQEQPEVQQPISIPQPPMGFHQFVYESPTLHYVVPLAPQAEVRHAGAKPAIQPTMPLRQPTIPLMIPQARKIGNGPIGQLIQKLLANFFRL